MHGVITTTLENLGIGGSSLDVEIGYEFVPGEKPVMHKPDGSGDPGSPADVELLVVHVTCWDRDGFMRQRAYGHSRLWDLTDDLAYELVERDWERIYKELCIEDAQQREETREI